MIKNIVIIILLMMILIFTNYKTVFAQIEVSGNITENTTWTKDNSPYIVTGTVQVLQNVKLTIESGVNIIFNNGTSLNIDGELIAIGSESDSIVFDGMEEIYFSNNSVDYQLDPNGNYLSGSTIQFVTIRNGTNGISIRYSSPFISNNTIDNQSFYGIKMHYSGSIIKKNLIYDCYDGIYFTHYDISGSGDFCIIDNIIINNTNNGIRGKQQTNADISRNTILNNSVGIFIDGTYTTPNITYNNIFDNVNYNFKMGTNYRDVNAINNFWGSTNIQSISSSIYDYYDDINYNRVNFQPYLTTATPTNLSSLELKTDITYSANLETELSITDTLFIELTGIDGDESYQDTTNIYVINENNVDSISVKLIETSSNTGIYRGISYFSVETDDELDIIGAEKGDNIKIVSAVDNTVYKQFLSIGPLELYYIITASTGIGGNIIPSGSVEVDAVTNKTFTITPNTGYVITDVIVDGVSQGSISTYTFSDVTSNHSISVTFSLISYTITASVGDGGTISPSENVVVSHGSNQAFTISPNSGYVITDVIVDGVSQGGVSSFTLNNITSDHTVSVTFSKISYTITASVGDGGTISPSGSVSVNHGTNQEFTIASNTGYTISDVIVDGVSQGSISTYTFSDVTSNHTISATFAISHTVISSNIIRNTTWTKTNSPYLVTGTVNVYSGATLTIEPGVVVKLDSSVSIQIGGELIARGTENDSIFFIQNEQAVRWGTIRFIDSSVDATYDDENNYISGSVIEYARIEGAGNSGIYLDSASPFIYRNTISDNLANNVGGGIYCYKSSSNIFENTISYNSADRGGSIYCFYFSPIISGNTILGNTGNWTGGGIYCVGSTPIISENTILNNISEFGGGIYCYNSAWPTISKNKIVFNSAEKYGGGIYCYSTSPEINYNNIYANNNFDIYAKKKLDAKNNWWGIAEKDSIDEHIWDYWDDITLGEVTYEPFLTSATPINISSITLKTDNTYLTDLTTLSTFDTVYIEITGTDGDETNQDTTIAYVINQSNTDSISVKLVETSLNTGIYRGIAYFSSVTNDDLDILGAEKGDNIKIVSAADNSVYKEFLSIVPVELGLFNSKVENNSDIILNWNTLSETNNYGFEIQRSIDNVEFEKVGFVSGNGTTSDENKYTFNDKCIYSGVYYYRLKQIDFDGSYEYSNILKVEINTPKIFSLYQNYPNPFNPETTIKYQLPEKSLVTLKIYNIYGQEIKTLIKEVQNPGAYKVVWDGTNEKGIYISSGVYLYAIKTKDFFASRKMILLR